MISRLTINTSNTASRCLVASYNNHLLFSSQQHQRYITQNTSNKQSPGRIRRFFLWFTGRTPPIRTTSSKTKPPPIPQTTMQRVKRFLALSPLIERFFLGAHIIQDEDLARLISKTAAITIYAFIAVTTLGTFGIDTKPLLAGIGITGFTIGFALKEVATNFISGVFLVINKPFVRGCRIKIHGSGGGIEGKFIYISIYCYLYMIFDFFLHKRSCSLY
jgi:small-conductance mechanosensitive channel